MFLWDLKLESLGDEWLSKNFVQLTGRFMAFYVDLLLTFCVSDCHKVSLINGLEVFDWQ